MGNKRVVADSSRCIGCQTCMAACIEAHDIPGNIAAPRLRVTRTYEISAPVACHHCEDAPCAKACPTGALFFDPKNHRIGVNEDNCIFCGRCEEACPMEAIKLTEEFELAVMSKDDLTSKSVYTLEHCSRCGKPFAPHKEIDYAKRLLQKAGGMEAIQAARTVGMCQECKRELDALRAASAFKTGNAAGMVVNETLASGESQGPGMEYLGGHGMNPEYIDRELNPDAPEIPAGPAPVEGIIMDFETKEE